MHICHASSNHYGRLQWMTAGGATLLTIGAIATALIPQVLAITTFVLPVILGVGALAAWLVFLALSLNRCLSTSNQEKRTNIPPSLSPVGGRKGGEKSHHKTVTKPLLMTCTREVDLFLKEIETQLTVEDIKVFISATSLALESVQECACGVKDPEVLETIQNSFFYELNSFRQIAQALSEGKSEDPKAKEFKIFIAIQQLLSSLRKKPLTARDTEQFQQLLEGISDINRSFNTIGDNPLMLVAKFGYPKEFIEILIAKGANFDYQETFFGNTALIWALANANNSMALEIIEKGKQNLDLKDKSRGNTALLLAVGKGYTTHSSDGEQLKVSNLQLVEALLERGADPNIPDNRGMTPLKLAVMRRDPAMVAALLKGGGVVDFEYQKLLELSYEAVSEKLKSQVCVFTLTHSHFESSKQSVLDLLSK